MAKRIYLTDKEVCTVLEVSDKTLSRMLNGFFCKTPVRGAKRIDIREAEPDAINGSRRWRLNKLASILGVTPEEIERRIS